MMSSEELARVWGAGRLHLIQKIKEMHLNSRKLKVSLRNLAGGVRLPYGFPLRNLLVI
jgi:hypothetical protein